jgi:hypothetical protein
MRCPIKTSVVSLATTAEKLECVAAILQAKSAGSNYQWMNSIHNRKQLFAKHTLVSDLVFKELSRVCCGKRGGAVIGDDGCDGLWIMEICGNNGK